METETINQDKFIIQRQYLHVEMEEICPDCKARLRYDDIDSIWYCARCHYEEIKTCEKCEEHYKGFGSKFIIQNEFGEKLYQVKDGFILINNDNKVTPIKKQFLAIWLSRYLGFEEYIKEE